jgi:hypothetical protein
MANLGTLRETLVVITSLEEESELVDVGGQTNQYRDGRHRHS